MILEKNNEEHNMVQQLKGWILPVALLFLAIALLAYTTLLSLFRPLSWAILLAFIFYPAFLGVLSIVGKTRNSLAALLVTFLMIVLLVAPTMAAGVVTSREAIRLFGRLVDLVGGIDASKGLSLDALFPDVLVRELLPMFEKYPLLKDGIQQLVSWTTSTMVRLSRNFLGNIATLAYHQIIIFIAFYFLLRDGHVLLEYFKDIIPLMSDERDEFMRRTGVVLRAVVFGVVLTAGVQGVLGAIGWWFVGLSSPLLAGALMALLAMIPFVGTPTVWIPGAIYLFLVGDNKKALILILWGLCVVSTVDNFLRPYFISGKANMSTLLVFLGAFGGLAAWGFMGLFVGPLILSLLVFSLDFYRKVWMLYQTQTTQDICQPRNSEEPQEPRPK
ncbi:MAG: AI-2E family transporter [Synergistaceae bacterium]|nr:AI-2E family transporter [Synergistaceae bacterium]